MKTKLSKKFWVGLVIFSLTGQIAWIVENMYFNVFIYKMFHASAAQISMMVSASAIAATLTTLLIGALSDKIGKRKLIICLGYIFWGISILCFALLRLDLITKIVGDATLALSVGVTLVIIMDCVMTFFGSSANDACFNAWLTDMGDDSNRGAIEGINSMMPLLAILVVFGGFMSFDLDHASSWVTIYLIIGIAVIIIGLLGFFLIDEKKLTVKNNQPYFANILYGFKKSVILENKLLYLVLGAFSVFGISIQIFMPYLILYYEKTLGMDNYVLIMAPAIILASVITAFYGRVYDRLQFRMSVIPVLISLMAGYVLLFFGRSTAPVFIGSLLMMTGYLTGMAVFGAMIKDHIPKDKAGLFQGLRMFAQVFIPGIIGPAIGAGVLQNAKEIVNNDGTTSFLPSANIYLAAFIVAGLLFLFLHYIFEMIKNEHRDLHMDQYEVELPTDHDQYPRPQLRRDSFYSLNGIWDIKMDASKEPPKEWNQTILVPYPPQAYLSNYDMRFTHHGMRKNPRVNSHFWYHKKFSLPKGFVKDRVILHFGAVDQVSVIYLNGERIYENKGGYLPFSIEITKWLNDENELLVEVTDNLSTIYPYGKQCKKRGGMWYTPVSGIWQSVWIESVPDAYISGLYVTPSLDSVEIKLETMGNEKLMKHLCITTPYGHVKDSFTEDSISVSIENPVNWTPEQPYLYEFTIQMGEDFITSYFALRTVTIEKVENQNRICLNEKPYYFHGVLDQGYFSDGIYTPRSMKCYEDDILNMKRLGFNTLRKHIKIEPAAFYYACDRLGMIVFQDMVNNSEYSFFNDTVLPTLQRLRRNDLKIRRKPEAKAFFEKHCEDTLNYLYHFPCICYYTLFNEGWGQYESDRICDHLRTIDSTRVWDATSGWFKQKSSDVLSLHVYFHPVILEPTEKPIIISEFGGYSHKILARSYSVHGVYGYGDYDSKEALTDAISRLYKEEIIPNLKAGINGSIYTQLSDVEDETNGFLTYDRKELKVDEKKMQEIAKLIFETWKS
ncbi:MAG: MFS transporter [Clostridia bacterium]|nr:MFS transporter [Clostridia bacterium]